MTLTNGALRALTGSPRTGGYRTNRLMSLASAPIFGGWGPFHLGHVDQMRRDPQIKLCLGYRKAPLYQAEFVVEAANPEEKAYVEASYTRFWRKSLRLALRSYEYGYAGCEVLYKQKAGRIIFDRLKYIHPSDVVPYTLKSQLAYMRVIMSTGAPVELTAATQELPGKAFWLAHDADCNPWFGQSVMETIWVPWRMKNMPQGALEVLFK